MRPLLVHLEWHALLRADTGPARQGGILRRASRSLGSYRSVPRYAPSVAPAWGDCGNHGDPTILLRHDPKPTDQLALRRRKIQRMRRGAVSLGGVSLAGGGRWPRGPRPWKTLRPHRKDLPPRDTCQSNPEHLIYCLLIWWKNSQSTSGCWGRNPGALRRGACLVQFADYDGKEGGWTAPGASEAGNVPSTKS